MKGLLFCFLILFYFDISIYAQSDCNCTNTPTPQKYKAKVVSNENVQICSQCATLALYQCICDCKTTNMTRAELETAIKQIETTLKEYERLGNDICCKELLGRKLSCPNAGTDKGKNGDVTNAKANTTNSKTAADLNNETVSFVNSIGMLTNNPDAQKELEKINKRHETFGAVKSGAAATGANTKQLEAIDNLETVAHLGSFLFGAGATDEEKRESDDQRKRDLRSANAVSREMDKLSDKLEQLHKDRIPDYDNKTAKYRLLLLKFLLVPNKEEDSEYFTEEKFLKLSAKVDDMEKKGVEYMKAEIDNLAKHKKFCQSWYDYLRNKRTNDSSSAYTNFVIPTTFNVPRDKVFKIEKRGEGKVTRFYIGPIYDIVFDSKDINKLWDGTHDKKPVPSGEYKYKLEGFDAEGQYFLMEGKISLIR